MRYCHQCHRVTAGQPMFCNFCGRSYDFKLCPSRHPNSRSAEICSQCGSRELSTPHPRVPLWLTPLLILLSAIPGLLLFALTILFFIGFVTALAQSPQLQFQFLIVGFVIALLWYLYMHLPQFLRHFITKLIKRSNGDDHGH